MTNAILNRQVNTKNDLSFDIKAIFTGYGKIRLHFYSFKISSAPVQMVITQFIMIFANINIYVLITAFRKSVVQGQVKAGPCKTGYNYNMPTKRLL